MNRIPSAFFLSILVCMAIFSCRLDVQALKEDTLKDMDNRELLYFQENIQGIESRDDLTRAAGEASRRGHVHILSYLKTRGADLNRPDAEGWSPVLHAAEAGSLETLRFLIEKVGCDPRARTRDRVTALMLAADGGYLDVCRYLLDRGANINARSRRGSTALMFAAASGNPDLTALLLEAGADPRIADNTERRARDYATGPKVKALLDGSARQN